MLALQRGAQLPQDSLTRVISAVFRQPEYVRSLRRTLAEDVLHWIGSLFRSIASSLDAHPLFRFLLLALVLGLIGSIAIRAIYARRMQEAYPEPRHSILLDHDSRDPWAAAQAAAAAGNYLDAAHLLYLAVLQTLARSDRIVIESAKTVGDYTRELRHSSSGSLKMYRDFARIYEPIVWGSHGCDSSKFEKLYSIASSLSGRAA